MTRAGRSVYLFGVYLVVTGGVLIGSPNTLFALLRLPSTNEPWAHVLGVAVMAMGMLHVATARAELVPFFRASIWVRVFVLLSFVVMATLRVVPPIVIAFGLTDAAFAFWTYLALRGSSLSAGGRTN
jgi:hypothetical protein